MTTAIRIKNPQTQKIEAIKQSEITKTDWGFRFFVESEIEAYKAAYSYRNNPYGVKVEYAGGAQQWMVTVFNAVGESLGFNK